MNKKQYGATLLITVFLAFAVYTALLALLVTPTNNQPTKTQSATFEEIVVAPLVDEVVPEVEVVEEEVSVKDNIPVRLTYYNYEGNRTASGHLPEHFEVDSDLGAFTYEGKIVVATANLTRLKGHLYEGYKTFDLNTEFELIINDTVYPAIVLDVCGACYGMSQESVQRIDVYVPSGVTLPDLATLRVVHE